MLLNSKNEISSYIIQILISKYGAKIIFSIHYNQSSYITFFLIFDHTVPHQSPHDALIIIYGNFPHHRAPLRKPTLAKKKGYLITRNSHVQICPLALLAETFFSRTPRVFLRIHRARARTREDNTCLCGIYD